VADIEAQSLHILQKFVESTKVQATTSHAISFKPLLWAGLSLHSFYRHNWIAAKYFFHFIAYIAFLVCSIT
jgi:hypothetical protein